MRAQGTFGDTVFWLSGVVTPRVRAEAEARGWTIRENVSRTWLAQHDAEMWTPGQAPDDSVLPEIGSGGGKE